MAINVPVPSEYEFLDLRRGIAACIKALNTSAVVHDNNALRANLQETVDALTSNEGFIHSWTVHISEIDVRSIKTGGNVIQFPLTIKINGYMGFEYGTDTSGRQATLERECLEIIKLMYLNHGYYGMVNPAPLAEMDVKDALLKFEEIAIRAFGTKNTLMVAEGTMTVIWEEPIQVQ